MENPIYPGWANEEYENQTVWLFRLTKSSKQGTYL